VLQRDLKVLTMSRHIAHVIPHVVGADISGPADTCGTRDSSQPKGLELSHDFPEMVRARWWRLLGPSAPPVEHGGQNHVLTAFPAYRRLRLHSIFGRTVTSSQQISGDGLRYGRAFRRAHRQDSSQVTSWCRYDSLRSYLPQARVSCVG
jgi:hypothetical protein